MPCAGAGGTAEPAEADGALDAGAQGDIDAAGVGDTAGRRHGGAARGDLTIVDADRDGCAIAARLARRSDADTPSAVERAGARLRDRHSQGDHGNEQPFAKTIHDAPLWL